MGNKLKSKYLNWGFRNDTEVLAYLLSLGIIDETTTELVIVGKCIKNEGK